MKGITIYRNGDQHTGDYFDGVPKGRGVIELVIKVEKKNLLKLFSHKSGMLMVTFLRDFSKMAYNMELEACGMKMVVRETELGKRAN